jgi:hypothetical protein
MFTSIDIDFDVYKELTFRRKAEDMTENDVLRELLGLSPTELSRSKLNDARNTSEGIPWVSKGVTFPHGTEFRADYSGRKYDAKVENGALVYNGKPYKTPSAAAMSITNTNVNGWGFWECKLPGKSTWLPIDKLRKK